MSKHPDSKSRLMKAARRTVRALGLSGTAARFFLHHWKTFASSILFVFLFTVFTTLYSDGKEIFLLQRDALVLDVFSRTDLPPDSYRLLEEQLRALPGVQEVLPVPPEESLKRLAGDPKLGLDAEWLAKKAEEQKGKNTILPWSYRLYLAQWDEPFLKQTLGRIEGIEVGYPPLKAAAETHYDPERWSLAYALLNYIQWISAVLLVNLLFLLGFLFAFFVKWMRWFAAIRRNPELPGQWQDKAWFLRELWSVLLLGAACGLFGHLLYLLVLSLSFFSDSFDWRGQFGQFLPVQLALAVLIAFLRYGFSSLDGEIGRKEEAR